VPDQLLAAVAAELGQGVVGHEDLAALVGYGDAQRALEERGPEALGQVGVPVGPFEPERPVPGIDGPGHGQPVLALPAADHEAAGLLLAELLEPKLGLGRVQLQQAGQGARPRAQAGEERPEALVGPAFFPEVETAEQGGMLGMLEKALPDEFREVRGLAEGHRQDRFFVDWATI